MKSKAFFEKLKNDGKINDAEYGKFLETVPDFEIPDKGVVDNIESAFYTLDRAAARKEVHGKIKREVLDPIDNDLKKILGVVDQVDKFKASEIDRMQSTYDKAAAIRDFLPQMIDKVKAAPSGGDEELKKKLKAKEDSEAELLSKIEKINSEYSTKEKALQKDFEDKISGYRIDTILEKLSNKFTLAEGYEKTRDAITKVLLTDLKSKNTLVLGEKDGQATINVLGKEGKPRFNGNTPITIENLLEEAHKPFIKVSNTGDGKGAGATHQETNQFQVQNPQNQNRRTGARTTVQ